MEAQSETTALPAANTAAPAQPNEVAVSLRTAYDKAAANIPEMKKSVATACMHLAKITAITNDEEDVHANKVLVKTRNTFEGVEGKRKEITDPLDAIKQLSMQYEKQISTDSKAVNSEYNRVRKLRDAYATEKANKAAAEKKRLEDDQAQKDEMARIRAEFGRAVVNGVAANVSQVANAYAKMYAAVTLETFAEIESALNRVPMLKADIYHGWFSIGYNTNLVAAQVFSGMVTDAKLQYTYENSNTDFVNKSNVIINDYKAKIPARKTELEQLAELAKTNQEAADNLKAEQDEKALQEAQQQQDSIQQDAAAATDAVNLQEQDEKMENAFVTQSALQKVEEPEGVRNLKTAVLNCSEEELVKTIAMVFYHCFINQKYKGIYKRDKSRQIKLDDEGQPLYQDWLQEMLDFFANNTDTPIEGVEIKPVTKAITSAKKTA